MKPPKRTLFQFLISSFLFFVFLFSCNNLHPQEKDFSVLRNSMVNEQIAARGITDKEVLSAMRKVERHLFVPEKNRPYAYRDYPLPIGYEQTISQPYIVAFMTQVIGLEKTSKVLEIGTGSGYQAAILAEICDSVFSVEIIPQLGLRADSLLRRLNYSNVKIKIGDGYKGWSGHAPYDAIIVTCAPSEIPQPLIDQLAEGGRMIIPVGKTNSVQELILLRKKNGKLTEQSVLPVRFVPMINEGHKPY